MTLLLTNDDGIEAPGLHLLEELVADLPHADLPHADLPHIVAAPRLPHSGCGHRVTAHQPIRVESWAKQTKDPLADPPKDQPAVPFKGAFKNQRKDQSSAGANPRYAIHGTPADCTRLAIANLCPEFPHWVLSGINAGGNLGVDVYISGTVAAVREAAYQGIPGIALSQYLKGGQEPDWFLTGIWAARVLGQLLKQPPQPGCFWNVNLPWPTDVPAAAPDGMPELVFCEPSRDPLPLLYKKQPNPQAPEHPEYMYAGRYGDRAAAPGTDVAVCFGGGIAITHLSA